MASGRSIIAGAGVTAGTLLGMGGVAHAATFTVNSLGDAGDGTCDATAGGCTLRDALDDAAANNNAPTSDQIVFDSSITGSPGTITLGGAQLPTIDEPLYIDGPGAAILTVDANDTSRIFQVDNAGGVTVDGLTLTGGHANSITERGGAIYSSNSTLVVSGSVVTASAVDLGVGGGGIWADHGSLSIQSSTVSGNSANGTDSEGGGILAAYLTTLSIADSSVSGNTVSGGGVSGGGVEVYQSGPATVTSSTIAGNTATGTASLAGAALLNDLASVTISDSTISGNHAGGGPAGVSIQDSPVTIEESTLTGNGISAPYGGGGALNVTSTSDTFTLRSSTIAGNDGGYSNGGVYWDGPAAATVTNTIVAGNQATNSPDLGGGPFDAAFDLIGSTSGATVNTTVTGSNIVGQNPQLGALADNGGETLTMLPDPTSPAIDCGSDSSNSFDQRGTGFPRVVDQANRANSTATGANGSDIGAAEVAANALISGACANNAPPPPSGSGPGVAPGPTGARAAALRKCKKKPKGAKRRKCLRRARRLPL